MRHQNDINFLNGPIYFHDCTTLDNNASYQRDNFVIKQSDKDYWFIEFYSNSIFNQGLHLQEIEHCQIGLDMELK